MAVNRKSSMFEWMVMLCVTFMCGVASMSFIMRPANISVFWLTNAVAIVFFVLFEQRRRQSLQPGLPRQLFVDRIVLSTAVISGVTLGNLVVGNDFLLSLTFGVANAVEVFLAVVLLRAKPNEQNPLVTLTGALRLGVYVPLIACSVGASIGAFGAAVQTDSDFFSMFQVWLMADVAAMALIVPIGLAIGDPRLRCRPTVSECAHILACAGLSFWLFRVFENANRPNVPPSILFPLLVLCGVSVRPLVMAVIPALVGGVSLLAVAMGRGTYLSYADTLQAQIQVVQSFCWAVAAVATWTCAAVSELKDQRRLAEIAAQAKSRFVATVSHEVRTPMTAIIGVTENLLDEELPPSVRAPLEDVRTSARSLLRILNDILDHARLEAGKAALSNGPTDIRALLASVSSMCGVLANETRVTIELDVAPRVPVQLVCDEGRLRQVLWNLVSNGVKFTPPEGKVRVVVEVEEKNGYESRLRLTVSDTGSGIEPAAQLRIFEPFEQESEAIQNRFGGTGLGLAISSELVSLMGGTLQVTSTPGAGAAFSFSIPLVPTSNLPTMPQPQPLASPLNLRVLVAEDNAVNQRILRKLLEKLSCRVQIVENGRLAVDAFEQSEFDIVLMDLSMPVMSGASAAREMRRLESSRARRTPIVGVTALMMDERGSGIDLEGLDYCISKPYDPEQIRMALLRATKNDKASA